MQILVLLAKDGTFDVSYHKKLSELSRDKLVSRALSKIYGSVTGLRPSKYYGVNSRNKWIAQNAIGLEMYYIAVPSGMTSEHEAKLAAARMLIEEGYTPRPGVHINKVNNTKSVTELYVTTGKVTRNTFAKSNGKWVRN